MLNILIPHKTWVLVGDGRKALVLCNEGDARLPNLRATTVFKGQDTPSTSQLGTDAPGRVVANAGGSHSAVEQTDWHDIAERQFAQVVAATLCEQERSGSFASIIVVAPPRTLASLREEFTAPLKAKIIAEVDKDLTRHPIPEIERILTGTGK